eukprot:CAMPEP_0114512246 /NCGR_PEP_ID=MMETSP0109-20121206/14862_1 /TAXON_ID=29199 /ORGANISM="Chlorarachnion reptans, Strain CCCM449" /LENGTH=134 /DNA_ID=CAMNT_0001691895 /DNA_START=671 /DNA_END=1075 /DNA_ORIENTATION=-
MDASNDHSLGRRTLRLGIYEYMRSVQGAPHPTRELRHFEPRLQSFPREDQLPVRRNLRARRVIAYLHPLGRQQGAQQLLRDLLKAHHVRLGEAQGCNDSLASFRKAFLRLILIAEPDIPGQHGQTVRFAGGLDL